MASSRKVFVFGLDCAAPKLVFDRFREDLPNINKLISSGQFGELTSTLPPITVPAWAAMMSSKDPGQLGIYGFRNRADYSYDNLSIVFSRNVKEPLIWDILGQKKKKSVVLGFPPSYPVRPLNGWAISCFLTPSAKSEYAYPPELKKELEEQVGPYIPDVMNFRTDNKDDLLKQIYEMADNHYEYAKYLLKNKDWDFFSMVEMSIDRVHHGFWKFCNPDHPKYEPNNPYETVLKDLYVYTDKKLGELMECLDDNTSILVVSDHGAKTMVGGICINEWLIQEGYLTLEKKPEKIQKISDLGVKWDQTRAWGEGGYYARIFLNVKGREPEGAIESADYKTVRSELKEKLENMKDHEGNHMGTKVYFPEEIYKDVKNIAPDLIVLFGNLTWRSVGTVGYGSIYTFANDTGPDDANHAMEGMYVLSGKGCDGGASGGKYKEREIYDIAPTILDQFGLEAPDDYIGTAIQK